MEHHGVVALYWLLGMLPFLLLAVASLCIAYLRYRARLARDKARAEATPPGTEDPVWELVRVNNEIALEMERGRVTVEAIRETVAKGTR